MRNAIRRNAVYLLLVLMISCTKDTQPPRDQVKDIPTPQTCIGVEKDTYDGVVLEDLILMMQKKRISRIVCYFHDDGNISPIGSINISTDIPEFSPFPNSGEMREYELLQYDSDKLVMDLIVFWVGAEEIYPGERKTVSKFKIILTAGDARKALIDSQKELAIPARRISSLDVGPLTEPWDGSFVVKKPIEAVSPTPDGEATIDVHIDGSNNVVLLNYSDQEIVYNRVNQYMLKIRSGDKEGWIPEEYIAFRELGAN